MKCERCDKDVPTFLWINDDHPVLLDRPANIYKDDLPTNPEEYRITSEIFVSSKMCSEVYPSEPTTLLNLSVSTPIEEAVGTAIGAASMCWENVDAAGVFDSTRAKTITDELVEYIGWKQPIY